MFDMLNILIQAVMPKLSPKAIADARQDAGRVELGTELFLLYLSLVGILNTGRQIIQELEDGLQWMDRKVDEGNFNQELHTYHAFSFQQQTINIIKLVDSIKQLGLQLHVIPLEVMARIAPLIYGKLNPMDCLIRAISSPHESPKLVDASKSEIAAILDTAASLFENLTEEPEMAFQMYRIASRMQRERKGHFLTLLDEVSLPDVSAIPARKNREIRRYLAERKPHEALDEIADSAHSLRESLLGHFTLADMLIEVGDRRTTLAEPWV